MAMKWRKKLVLAKIETTYGSDITPTAADNAVLVNNVELSPVAANEVSRELEGRGLGNQAKMLTNVHSTLSCSVELAGSGAAGTAPAWGVLLRACGFGETITSKTGAANAAYKPISASEPSLTIYFYIDGALHKLTGCRGSASFSVAAGEIPVVSFAFTGLFNALGKTTYPSGTFTAYKQPLVADKANTPTFTIGSDNVVLASFSADMGSTVIHRDLIGAKNVQITDRNATGEAVIEATPTIVSGYINAAKAGSSKALNLVHGTETGNIVQISAPKVQFGAPTYQERDSAVMLTLPLNFVPNTGDDELVVTVK